MTKSALTSKKPRMLYRRLQAAVRVRYDQLHALQTALFKAQQKGQPERFSF